MRSLISRETFFVLSNLLENTFWEGEEYEYTSDIKKAKKFKNYDQAYCFAIENDLATRYPTQLVLEWGFAE